MNDRRSFLMQGVAAATLLAFPGFARAATRGGRPSEADIVIRRNPGCQCCHLWVEHLELHGFTVSMEEDQDMQGYKDELGVPADPFSQLRRESRGESAPKSPRVFFPILAPRGLRLW